MVKILGITDETSVCECCGKTNLKRVVVLDFDGDIRRYGRDCAAKAFGKSVGKSIDSLVEVKAYIDKWQSKYSPEIIVKGIWEKLGYTAQYKDGQYHIWGVGTI